MRILRVAAAVEAASLVLLLANLFTAHLPAVSSLAGPVHGTAYLVTIAVTWHTTDIPAARWCSLIPGFGGLLTVRRLPAGREPTGGSDRL
ncbi:DUF3817 domain-containing protein [Streptomyces hainanensis]|uniref:DUF3817 domain-containing protein n=1 Tax=Streptomyces hainanensis TaxID=402648 RepID=A0A4R4TH17_9ACTN|nr:DUF3817 domain-containing protein [Streptomyces hainanensis]TDC74512.1 DUF3817 domain-containing protein [Streptomyces hainanensis]